MIVGTAGHIDHGKTTLVRALTGVDTDRLPEEKRRGISIELGYAYLAAPNGRRIGFVDVPGHERLVHTMVAGASGIDLALLLVAADDGVMPQTREHLAVLSLLGVARGAVVLTKIDRADAQRLAALGAEVAALTAGSTLEGWPLLEVSALTGQGVDALRAWIFDAAAQAPARSDAALGFRLALDRAFTLAGIGTVVTGRVHAGGVQIDDALLLVPLAKSARVRSVRAQDEAVARAGVGQRCALGLAGLAKDDVERGQWLVAPQVASTTQRLDARLTLWHGEARALRSGASVHLHLGAADTVASVTLLDAGLDTPKALEPGASARVQLRLAAPIAAWHGDRFLLRDASATRTLAGGVVLDPQPPTRRRAAPLRRARLDAWEQPNAEARLGALLAASPEGLDIAAWARAEGRVAAPPALAGAGLRAGDWALAEAHREATAAALLAGLADFHARQPQETGPDLARARRLFAPGLAEPLWRGLVADLVARGQVLQRGAWLQLPEHAVQLSADEARIAGRLLPRLEQGGFDPPWVRELAAEAGESEALLRAVFARLARQGELHAVVKDLYYPEPTLARLAALVREVAAQQGGAVTAAAFRDATGLGRKRAIQILEYFDRVGLLRRVRDAHRLREEAGLFAGVAAPAPADPPGCGRSAASGQP
ncbi:MAG: selenocysteine-specific translation elongation factor [Burkholderiales bacterium]|nr:selenocysteine-specific translation elongation factor [Burkholderiales bacterium]